MLAITQTYYSFFNDDAFHFDESKTLKANDKEISAPVYDSEAHLITKPKPRGKTSFQISKFKSFSDRLLNILINFWISPFA